MLSLSRGVRDLQLESFRTRPQEDKETIIEKLTDKCNKVIGQLDEYMKIAETDKATEELITQDKNRVLGYLETIRYISNRDSEDNLKHE